MSETVTLGAIFTGSAKLLLDELGKVNVEFDKIQAKAATVSAAADKITKAFQGIAAATKGIKGGTSAISEFDKAMLNMSSRGTTFQNALLRITQGINKFSTANQAAAKIILDTDKNLARIRAGFDQYLQKIQGITRGSQKWTQEMGRISQGAILARASMAQFTGQVGNSVGSLTAWIAASQKAVGMFGAFAASAGTSGASLGKLGAAYSQLSAASQNQIASLKRMHSAMGLLNQAQIQAGASAAAAASNTNKATKAMADQEGVLGRLVKKFKDYAIFMASATAVFGFINALRQGVAAIIDFDQALKNLQAISGATTSQIAAMSEKMLDIARDTKFSSTEIGEGMVLLAQAGLSAGEAIETIQAVANLATGTLTDMATTADLVTSTMRAFNIESKEANRIADVFANAINKSKLTVDKLRTSFNYIGISAAQAGLSLEEVAASAMVLANSGQRASTIGTGLRQVIAKLLAPTDKMASSLLAQGVALDDLNPKLVGYEKVLENLAGLLWDNAKGAVDMGKAYDYFRLRGAQAAAAITEAFMSGKYDEAMKMVKRIGTAMEMAGIQAEGLAVKFKNMADRAGNLAIAVGDAGLAKAFGMLADTMRSVFALLEAFVKSDFGGMVTQFALATTGVAALSKAFLFLKTAMAGTFMVQFVKHLAGVTTAVGATSAAMWAKQGFMAAFQANPFMVWTTGIAALLVGLNSLSTRLEKVSEKARAQAIAFKQSAETLFFYRSTLDKLSSRPDDSYEISLKRFTTENKELAKSLRELLDVVDLSTVAWPKLAEAMLTVEKVNLTDELEEQAKSLDALYQKVRNRQSDVGGQTFSPRDSNAGQAIFTEKLNKATEKYNENIKEVAQSFAALNQKYKLSRVEINGMISAMDVAPEVAEDMRRSMLKAIDEIENKAKRAAAVFTDASQKLPREYVQMVSKLSASDKVAFAGFSSNLVDRLTKFRDFALKLGMAESEVIKSTEAMRAKSYADFMLSNDKTLAAVEDRERKAGEIVEGFIQQTVKEYRNGAIKRQEAEGRILGYMEVANEKYVASVRKAYGKVQGIVGGHIRELQNQYSQLQGKIEAANDAMASANESYAEDMRDVQQRTMTDEEKWLDDRKRANELLSEGLHDQNAETVKEAQTMFKALAREVKDTNGETVMSIEETSQVARAGIQQSHQDLLGILEAQKEKFTENVKSIGERIKDAESYLDGYKKRLEEVSNQKLTLDVSAVKSVLSDLTNDLDRFMAVAKAKETTVNVKFTGEASEKEPLSSKLKSIEEETRATAERLKDIDISIPVMQDGSDDSLEKAKDTIDSVRRYAEDNPAYLEISSKTESTSGRLLKEIESINESLKEASEIELFSASDMSKAYELQTKTKEMMRMFRRVEVQAMYDFSDIDPGDAPTAVMVEQYKKDIASLSKLVRETESLTIDLEQAMPENVFKRYAAIFSEYEREMERHFIPMIDFVKRDTPGAAAALLDLQTSFDDALKSAPGVLNNTAEGLEYVERSILQTSVRGAEGLEKLGDSIGELRGIANELDLKKAFAGTEFINTTGNFGGFFNTWDNEIRINIDSMEDAVRLADFIIEKSKEAGTELKKVVDRPWSASDMFGDLESTNVTLAHEFGHTIEMQSDALMAYTDKVFEKIKDKSELTTKYMGANAREFWSENYALFSAGLEGAVNKDLLKVFEKLHEKAKTLEIDLSKINTVTTEKIKGLEDLFVGPARMSEAIAEAAKEKMTLSVAFQDEDGNLGSAKDIMGSEFDALSAGHAKMIRDMEAEAVSLQVSLKARDGEKTGPATETIGKLVEQIKRVESVANDVKPEITIDQTIKIRTDEFEKEEKSIVGALKRINEMASKTVAASVDGAKKAYNAVAAGYSRMRGFANIYKMVFIGDSATEEKSLVQKVSNTYKTFSKTAEKISKLKAHFTADVVGEEGEPVDEKLQKVMTSFDDTKSSIDKMKASFTAMFVSEDGIPFKDAALQTLEAGFDVATNLTKMSTNFMVAFESDTGVPLNERFLDILDESKSLSDLVSNLGSTFTTDFLSADGLATTAKMGEVAKSAEGLASMIDKLVSSFTVSFLGEGSSVKPLTEKTKEMEGGLMGMARRVGKTITNFMTRFTDGDGNPLSVAVAWAKEQFSSAAGFISGKTAEFKVSLKAEGGKPISERISEITKGFGDLRKIIERAKAIFSIEFWMKDGASFDEQVEHIKERIGLLSGAINKTVTTFKAKFITEDGISFGGIVDWVKEKFKAITDYIGNATAEMTADIKIGGMSLSEGLGWAKDQFMSLVKFIGGLLVSFIADFSDATGIPIDEAIEKMMGKFAEASGTISAMKTGFEVLFTDEGKNMPLEDKLEAVMGDVEKTKNSINAAKAAMTIAIKADAAGADLPDAAKRAVDIAKRTVGIVNTLKGIVTIGFGDKDERPVEEQAADIIDSVGGALVSIQETGEKFGLNMSSVFAGFYETAGKVGDNLKKVGSTLARTFQAGKFLQIAKSVGQVTLSSKGLGTALTVAGKTAGSFASKLNIVGASVSTFLAGWDIGQWINKWDAFGLLPKKIGGYIQDTMGFLNKFGLMGPQVFQDFAYDSLVAIEGLGKKAIGKLKDFGSFVTDGIKSTIKVAFTGDDGKEKPLAEKIKDVEAETKALEETVQAVKPKVQVAFEATDGSSGAPTSVSEMYDAVFDKNTNMLTRLKSATGLVRIAFTGSDGTVGMEGEPLSKQWELLKQNLTSAKTNLGRIKSVYRVFFKPVGTEDDNKGVTGAVNGMVENLTTATSTISGMDAMYRLSIQDAEGDPILDKVSTMIGALKGASSAIGGLGTKFEVFFEDGLGKPIGDAVGSMMSDIKDAGQKIIDISPDFVVDFLGVDRTSEPFSDRVDNVVAAAKNAGAQISNIKAAIVTAFTTDKDKPIKDRVLDVLGEIRTFAEKVNSVKTAVVMTVVGDNRLKPIADVLNNAYQSARDFQKKIRNMAFDLVAGIVGKDNKPLQDVIKFASGLLDKFVSAQEKRRPSLVTTFTGHGSDEKPLTEKTAEMSALTREFEREANALKPRIVTKFEGEDGKPMKESFFGQLISFFGGAADIIEKGSKDLAAAMPKKSIFEGLFAWNKTGDVGTRVLIETYNEFETFYDKLDSRRKISFIEMLEGAKAEVAEYRSKAKAHKESEEAISATVQNIWSERFAAFKKISEEEMDTTNKASLQNVLDDIAAKTKAIQDEGARKIEAYRNEITELEKLQIEAEDAFLKKEISGFSAKSSPLYKALNESIGVLSEMTEEEIRIATEAHEEKVKVYLGSLSADEKFARGKEMFLASLDESIGEYSKLTSEEIETAKKRNAALAEFYGITPNIDQTLTVADKIRALNLKMSQERVSIIKESLGISSTLLDEYADKEKGIAAQSLGIKKNSLKAETDATKKALTDQERLDAEYAIERFKFWDMNKGLIDKHNQDVLAGNKAMYVDLEVMEKEANEARKRLYETDAQARVQVAEKKKKIVVDTAKEMTKAEKQYAKEIENIDKQVLEAKRKSYKEAREALKTELEASLQMEKDIAGEILDIRRGLAEEQKSVEEWLRDQKREGMSEQAAYEDKWAEINEKFNKAAALGNEQYAEKVKLIKEAMSAAKGMTGEVKDEEKTVISATAARDRATAAVKKMMSTLKSVDTERIKTLEKAQTATEKNTASLQKTLATADGRLEAIAKRLDKDVVGSLDKMVSKTKDFTDALEAGTKFELDTDEAEKKLDKLAKKAKEIAGKMGDAALKFATGGAVPGSGSGDTVPAMLTPDEHVIDVPTVQAFGGHGFFNWLRSRSKTDARDVMRSMIQKFNLGGPVKPLMPSVSVPRLVPQFTQQVVQHFAAGGAVQQSQQIANMGKMDLTIGNATVQVYDKVDQIEMFKEQLRMEKRRRPNDFAMGY